MDALNYGVPAGFARTTLLAIRLVEKAVKLLGDVLEQVLHVELVP